MSKSKGGRMAATLRTSPPNKSRATRRTRDLTRRRAEKEASEAGQPTESIQIHRVGSALSLRGAFLDGSTG
jgi:hypothetical protein